MDKHKTVITPSPTMNLKMLYIQSEICKICKTQQVRDEIGHQYRQSPLTKLVNGYLRECLKSRI